MINTSSTRPSGEPPSGEPTQPSGSAGGGVGAAGETTAVQSALAGEHAAVYGYGVIGAFLDGAEQDSARETLAAHRTRRDALRDQVRSAGAMPVAAHAVYRLPFEVNDADAARRLAAEIERRLTDVYVDLVAAATTSEVRKTGVDGVITSSRRAVRWSGETAAFPGLGDRPGSPISD